MNEACYKVIMFIFVRHHAPQLKGEMPRIFTILIPVYENSIKMQFQAQSIRRTASLLMCESRGLCDLLNEDMVGFGC